MPFGNCNQLGASCCQIIDLEEQWENDEPQKMLSNGMEIITTKSTLICRKSGMAIRAVTSGQDGVEAARIAKEVEMVREMEEKYPGLLSILLDPKGSLYLNEGKYQMALCFLEDCVEKHDGELEIISLYAEKSLEGDLIRAALDRLLPGCNVTLEDKLTEGLRMKGTEMGMDGVPGYDVQLLNSEMLEMIKEDSAATAERIETGGFYRWQEENKEYVQQISEIAMGLSYAYICYRYTMVTEQKKGYRREAAGKKSTPKVGEDINGRIIDAGSETSYGKSSGKLNWDAIVSKKGETRVDHINRHAVPNNSRETHGVFNGNPIDMVNDAWEQRHLVEPISDGMGGTIYNIPYKNAGYESGYINTGAQMDYITIVTLDESADLITAFPSFGDYHK